MKISYNWLKEYTSTLPKPEKLAEILTMHAFEVEDVEKKNNDHILNIDVLSNRGHDCLSHLGIAREISAITGSKFQFPKIKVKQDKDLKTKELLNVEVKAKQLCPRYTARIIQDVKVGPSPQWLKQKLESIGQQSINNVVDATNYIAFELGQPVHAFDADKLVGKRKKKIIVRKANKNEKIVTLDNEECKLDKDMLVIADSKNPLAIAGIKGGKKAEVDKNTNTVILESANFNSRSIYVTSRKLGIVTESSLRFEQGLDPNLASQAGDRLAALIKDVAGGKISQGILDKNTRKLNPRKISLSVPKLNGLLGINISKAKIIEILKSLGFEVKFSSKNQLWVTAPTRRLDVQGAEDLIEEVGRIYGYEKITARKPVSALASVKPSDELKIRSKVKNILEGLGLSEVYNYSFIGEQDLEIIQADSRKYKQLKNPLSLNLKYLRRDLFINLLKNIKNNFKYFENVKLFELGKAYLNKEKLMLTGVIARKNVDQESLFFEIKGIVDSLLNKLGISNQWYDNFEATPEWSNGKIWNLQRSAEIKVGNEEIGHLGEIDSRILSEFGIKQVVAAFNINFQALVKLAQEEIIYSPPSKYPAVTRDLAVLINKTDKTADVLNLINATGGELIRDVDLFDIYQGPEIPQGKKNLAFHIIYQSDKKTLTDKEVDKIHQKIINQLNNRTNWRVRD